MPYQDTIASTDIITASQGLTLTSGKWNTHFGIWRGHMLPVDASSSAAANNSYDLGSTTYAWRNGYINNVVSNTITSTDLVVNGKFKQTIASTTGAFSFGSQHMVLCNANGAAFTVTLPAAANYTGVTIALKKIDSTFNLITVDGNGSETVDSTTTTYLSTENECLFITSDGSNWQKKNRYIDGKWNTFTPTGTWSTNVTFTGKYKRIGNSVNCLIQILCSGGVTTGVLYINIPSGLTIDTTKFANFTTSANIAVGVGNGFDAGVSSYFMRCSMWQTSGSVFVGNEVVNNTYSLVGQNNGSAPFTWGSGDILEANFTVPIQNWEA